MAERFKAHAWKVCVLLKVPRVRIPVSPPKIKKIFNKRADLTNFGFKKINKINADYYFYKETA